MSSKNTETLIHLDFPKSMPSENPFLVQGWIISHSEIQAVWIPFEPKIPLTFVERADVVNAHPFYPHVKGFKGMVDIAAIEENTINLYYRLDSGEFYHSWCVSIPPENSGKVCKSSILYIKLFRVFSIFPEIVKKLCDLLILCQTYLRKCKSLKLQNAKKCSEVLSHRQRGYNLLTGNGLEIGAFHQPATIPAHCTIEYCDAQSKEDIIQNFPEININDLVDVNHICDLDKEGLFLFEAERFDFVILNHVIEHVANPINIVKELFRITKPGGNIVISAPDKNFTFDQHRALTSFAHLKDEYENNVTFVTDAHYIDFLRGVHPEVNLTNPEELKGHINNVKKRREHAHVWDSQIFSEFMLKTLDLLQLKATCEFVSLGDDNQFEYFSVWKKL